MSPKIFGDVFSQKGYVPENFITIILRVIFTYDYTPPKPHFSTRIPIACQLYEHAYKLLQKSFEVAFEVAQRPNNEPSYAPPATRQLIN